MLLPLMSPQVIAKWEPSTREYCESLVEALRGRDVIDAAEEYAQHIPVRVIARMLGFPEEDADRFRGFVHHVLEDVTLPLEQRFIGMQDLFEYLRVQVQDHIANPRDDLTTALLNGEMNGEPVGVEHVGGTVALLLLAGIDTTWSAIGASIWHLAGHPEDRERLVAEPESCLNASRAPRCASRSHSWSAAQSLPSGSPRSAYVASENESRWAL